MYDLKKVIPDIDNKSIGGPQLIAQMVIFYIGIAMFIAVCMIPPFTIFLPFLAPIVFITCAIVNIMLFIKFLQTLKKETSKLQNKIKL